MFRKVLGSLAIIALFATAACNTNSVTAPNDIDTTQRHGDRDPLPPAEYDKACIDDFRAVALTGPSESHRLLAEETVVVTWEVQHVCGSYMADVEVSYDGGRSFTLLGSKKNGVSISWKIPAIENAQPVLRVKATDSFGELTDDMAMASRIQLRPAQPNRDPNGDLD